MNTIRKYFPVYVSVVLLGAAVMLTVHYANRATLAAEVAMTYATISNKHLLATHEALNELLDITQASASQATTKNPSSTSSTSSWRLPPSCGSGRPSRSRSPA
jgi:hypothetical protein